LITEHGKLTTHPLRTRVGGSPTTLLYGKEI
jgi:hypothetical protein